MSVSSPEVSLSSSSTTSSSCTKDDVDYWEVNPPPTPASISRLNSLDCWDYSIELDCLKGPEGFSFSFFSILEIFFVLQFLKPSFLVCLFHCLFTYSPSHFGCYETKVFLIHVFFSNNEKNLVMPRNAQFSSLVFCMKCGHENLKKLMNFCTNFVAKSSFVAKKRYGRGPLR